MDHWRKRSLKCLYQNLVQLETVLQQPVCLKQMNVPNCGMIFLPIFAPLQKNTSDYIAHINSEEAEERMYTEAFLIYKDKFTAYLRDFIIGLQHTAQKIQLLLRSLNIDELRLFMQQVIVHQQHLPRFEDITDETVLMEELEARWQTLMTWFLGDVYREKRIGKFTDAYQLTNKKNHQNSTTIRGKTSLFSESKKRLLTFSQMVCFYRRYS